MRENGRDNGRPKSPVDHWETLEVLFSAQAEVGRDNLGIVVEVQRPIFEGGRAGRPSMGCVLRRGERMLRLVCRDGSTAEIAAFRSLLSGLDETKLAECAARYEVLRAAHAPPQDEDRRTSRREVKPGDVGGGLSRYSKTPKRDRKRSKHGDDDRRRRDEN